MVIVNAKISLEPGNGQKINTNAKVAIDANAISILFILDLSLYHHLR